jgi:hypothetical protein
MGFSRRNFDMTGKWQCVFASFLLELAASGHDKEFVSKPNPGG